MENNINSKHCITITKREKLQATGVLDVLSFDDENIVAQTDNGIMILKGYNLHINNLNLEKSSLDVDGTITGLTYDDEDFGKKGSMLSRIFK